MVVALLPIVWVWVNSHGSFVLGVLWLGAVGVGAGIDRRSFPRDLLPRSPGSPSASSSRASTRSGRGCSPSPSRWGRRVRSSAFVEWQSPNFQAVTGLVSLAFLLPAW